MRWARRGRPTAGYGGGYVPRRLRRDRGRLRRVGIPVHGPRRLEPTTPRKFACGVIGMGAAFLLFLPTAGTTGKAVPALLGLAIMAVFAVSELMISPIGLAVTTQLAPQAFRAQIMALYFFLVSLGTSLSGVLAKYYDPAREFAYFGILGVVAIAAGLVVFGLSGYISRLMEGVH